MREINQTARITVDTIPYMGVEVFRLTEDTGHGKAGQWNITVSGNFKERDNLSETVKVTRTYFYQWPNEVPTKKQLAKAVRELLIAHLKHEIDEGLWIDGRARI